MLIIFDLDGTLINTIDDLGQACNHALSACGFPTHKIEDYPRLVGNGINKLLERSLPEEERTEANVMRMREHFIPYYNEHNADLSCPYPGVSDLLRWLQESGVMIAVASNKYQAATERLVAHYFPEIRFVKVYGQRTDVPIKPDPTVVMEIMEQAGVERNEVLYVGDSGVDMQTGRNAGVDTVGVSWGFRPKSELESFSPMAIVDCADDLKKYVTAAK